MKIIRILMLLCVATTLTYCSDDSTDEVTEQTDDNGDNGDNGDNEDNSDNGASSEGDALDANVVVEGLRIPGGTQITAPPPQATGGISFEFEEESSALVGEGFEQYLTSDDTFDGVYLIINDVNGNVADSYYDIPADAFGRNTLNSRTTNRFFDKDSANRMVDQGLLDVGFDNSIQPGQFCYSVCIYDSNGNISQPQEICITVESFGGNDALVGTWNMTNITEVFDDVNISAGLNEEFCFNEDIPCNNGDTVAVTECSIYERFRFTFNADGSYILDERIIDNDIDYDATVEACEEIEQGEKFYEYLSEGFWAFNDTSGKLVTVESTYTENDNGEIFTDNFPQGEGEVLFDLDITISGNSFTIEDNYEDGSGDSFSLTFQKE